MAASKLLKRIKANRRLIIAAVVALVFGGGYYVWPRAPRSLTEALLAQPNLFPDSYRVMIPLSSQDRLGRRLVNTTDTHVRNVNVRVSETEPAPCLYVRPSTPAPGLGHLEFEYADSHVMRLELGALFTGAEANDKGNLKVIIDGLDVRTAVGIPNPNGPCGDFSTATKLDVVASEAIAKSVQVTGAVTQTAQASVAIDGGPGATTGWSAQSSSSLIAHDVVLGAGISHVNVEVFAPAATNLGERPGARVLPLPAPFDGHIVIVSYDAAGPVLALRAEAAGAGVMPSGPNDAYAGCNTGSDVTLTLGKRCLFWLDPGNSAVAVWWDQPTNAQGIIEVVVSMRGYRTTFSK